MHRNALITKLKQYRAQWPEECEHTDRFLAFVEDNDGCFKRQLQTGHVTGSAWIENHQGTSVLLLHHRKLDRWLQPGGHADGDPDTLEVAKREVAEETGLTGLTAESAIFDLDIHPIPARGSEPRHLHYDVRYRFTALAEAVAVSNHESLDCRWFQIEDVATWTEEPSLSRMAIKSINQGDQA
jgi:8-oxo-dGTP pyrophosphatase MutT (NUDIX family)